MKISSKITTSCKNENVLTWIKNKSTTYMPSISHIRTTTVKSLLSLSYYETSMAETVPFQYNSLISKQESEQYLLSSAPTWSSDFNPTLKWIRDCFKTETFEVSSCLMQRLQCSQHMPERSSPGKAHQGKNTSKEKGHPTEQKSLVSVSKQSGIPCSPSSC